MWIFVTFHFWYAAWNVHFQHFITCLHKHVTVGQWSSFISSKQPVRSCVQSILGVQLIRNKSLPATMNNTTFCDQAFTKHERQWLVAVYSSISTVSFILSIVAIIMLLFFRLWKRFPHRLFLYLLIAVLVDAFAQALNFATFNYDYESGFHSKLCSAVGFLEQYSSCVVLLFSTELVFHLFYLVLKLSLIHIWRCRRRG